MFPYRNVVDIDVLDHEVASGFSIPSATTISQSQSQLQFKSTDLRMINATITTISLTTTTNTFQNGVDPLFDMLLK